MRLLLVIFVFFAMLPATIVTGSGFDLNDDGTINVGDLLLFQRQILGQGVDTDGDGYVQGFDCDDMLTSVHPLAAELCDGVDNDCDGGTDEGFDLNTDPNNCGACDQVCTGDQLCMSGACYLPSCAAGEVACGDSCVDLANDQNNCGACDQVCTGDQLCMSGACYLPSCAAGEVACGDSCVDLANDQNNCGACDQVCTGDQLCISGVCN